MTGVGPSLTHSDEVGDFAQGVSTISIWLDIAFLGADGMWSQVVS